MVELIIIILGLVLGSFVAASTYRIPRNIAIWDGFSFCDRCKRKINWYENIPVVSYMLLGGKCRTCHKKISLRYPLIEFASAVFFILIYKVHPLTDVYLLFIYLIFIILYSIFIIDLEHQIIPDGIVFLGIITVSVFYLLGNLNLLLPNMYAGLAAASFLVIIYLLTLGRGMGLGDVKFAVLGGLIVGINNIIVWLFTAFLTGAGVGIILILLSRAKLKDKIAFGPFLVVAIPISIIWGNRLMEIIGFSAR